jgi:hypothetical protein
MRSVSPSSIVLILFFVSSTSCATITPASITQPTSDPAVINSSPTSEAQLTSKATSSPSLEWKTYTNSKYGFSINFPAYLEINLGENDNSLYIGEQIYVWISDINPLECRGDCPLVENTEPASVAGLEATKVTGYIGAVGGMIPQRYLQYILKHDNRYYSFTLSALRRDANHECCSVIWPLKENDIALFEQLLRTLSFNN